MTSPREPQFKVGDIIRYGSGVTALMRVDHVNPRHGSQPRYYGQQYFGGAVGVYEQDARPASEADLKKWSERK